MCTSLTSFFSRRPHTLVSCFSFSCRHVEQLNNTSHDEYKFGTIETDRCYETEDLVADLLGGETLLFLYKESLNKDTDLLDEVKDSKETFIFEQDGGSAYYSPQEDLPHDEKLGVGVELNDDIINDVLAPSDSEDFTLNGKRNKSVSSYCIF